MRSAVTLLLLLMCVVPSAIAQTEVPLVISGNEATGSFDINGVGADLSIRFEDVSGLAPEALRVTASSIDPLDPSLLSRLPPSGVGIPVGFPVLVHIDPPVGGGLAFEGVVRISLHTHNLEYTPESVLVLYSAHGGGPFADITREAGQGSYRVSGSSGTFSEFVVVGDARPIGAIIADKYQRLQSVLDQTAPLLPPHVAAELQSRLGDSRSRYDAGQTVEAIADLDGFATAVQGYSGTDIPDVWRPGGAMNVAGILRAGADTLRFSLDRKATRGY